MLGKSWASGNLGSGPGSETDFLCASVSSPSLQIRCLPSGVKAKACDPFPILTKENPSYAIPAFQEPFQDAKASSSYAFTKSSPQA